MVRYPRTGLALTLALAASAASPLGCDGECEFAIIAKNETCAASCATLNRQDIDEGVICAQADCSADAPCASGFVCVNLGKPVCLPGCAEDGDCENGLVCVDQDDALTGEVTKGCFFDG